MNRKELLEQLTEDILVYVMHGEVSTEIVAKNIKPQGLDERFDEYRRLVDLHFVLKPEVIDFVEALPVRLRRIKTQTRSISRVRNGTVDGRINWSSTIKTRYSQNPGDTALFVCDNRSEDYDVDENLVLKKLLAVIYSTLQESTEYLDADYDWIADRWKENKNLVRQLTQIVERNVHVRRIRKPAQYEPTGRMLSVAENSRHEIYREAAALLQLRDDILTGDENAIRTLLDETTITPDDEETLLELFVLFRFIATLERLAGDETTVRTIQTGRQEVARIQGEKEIVIYHDNSAGDRKLSFVSTPEEKSDEDLTRSELVHRMTQSVVSDYFGREFTNSTGRPDVIVLEIVSEDEFEYEYLITEVKNSTSVDTIRQGIKETLEYLAFLRVNDEYVYSGELPEEYFGSGWNGMLVIQDLDKETPSTDEQEPIKILQVSELESELEPILSKLV